MRQVERRSVATRQRTLTQYRGPVDAIRVCDVGATSPVRSVSATRGRRVRLSLHTNALACARTGRSPIERAWSHGCVAGCRISKAPFVVGVEGGHRYRPELKENCDDALLVDRARPRREEQVRQLRIQGGDGRGVCRDRRLQRSSTHPTWTWRSRSRRRGLRRAGARSRSVRSTASPEPARAAANPCRARQVHSSGSSARSTAA